MAEHEEPCHRYYAVPDYLKVRGELAHSFPMLVQSINAQQFVRFSYFLPKQPIRFLEFSKGQSDEILEL